MFGLSMASGNMYSSEPWYLERKGQLGVKNQETVEEKLGGQFRITFFLMATEVEPDFICKLVVIGDSNVGKSNLLSRYTTNTFKEKSKNTVGVDFGHKMLQIDDKSVKVTIWDTGMHYLSKCR